MDDMNKTHRPTNLTLVDENPIPIPIPEETDSQELFNLLPEEPDLPEPSTPTMAFPSSDDQLSLPEPPPLCYPQLQNPLMKSSLSKRHFSPSTGNTPRGEKEAVAELLMILVDCMEELNTRSRESLLRKFFSEIERDERLEKFIVERLRQSKVKAISDLCDQLPSGVREKISDPSSGEALGSIEEDPEVSVSDDGSQIPSSNADAGISGSFDIYYGTTSGASERSLIETVEDLSQEMERFKVRTLEVGGTGQEAQEEGKK